MKLFLYIFITTYVVYRTTNAFDIKYTLLRPPVETEMVEESYTPGRGSYQFTGGEPVQVDPYFTGLVDQPITVPFIVTAIFKSYVAKSSCLFSIAHGDDIVMRLCLHPAGKNVTRVSLITELFPSDPISYLFHESFKDNWIQLVLYVKDDIADLYVNCSKQPNSLTLVKANKVVVREDVKINLAFSTSASQTFKGLIEELNLFTNADDSTIEHICGKTSTDIESLGDFEDSATEPTPLPPETGIKGDKGEQGERGEKGDTGKEGENGSKGEIGETGPKGIKGEKGDKGDLGQKGDLGPQGPLGLQGFTGKQGEKGECQCSKDVVSSVLLSMTEMKGPAGERGPPGYDGKPGPPGETGSIGPEGERGPEGLPGKLGPRGDDGIPGRDGTPGERGEPGKDGAPGTPGLKGDKGDQGPPGEIRLETDEEIKLRTVVIHGDKGDDGPVGPPGLKGERGERGEKGSKGEIGIQGEKGAEGREGPEGPRGEKGKIGEAGVNGMPGIPGTHGRTGEKGGKGDRGDKGNPGLPGLPATLTSVLDAENADVVEKLRGYKGSKGETGEKGDKGDIGPIGLQGPKGKDGKDGIPGEKGEMGPQGFIGLKGDRGEPGPAGEVPASKIALLKGSKGDTGQPGTSGKDGRIGDKGVKGEIGPVGPRGPKGDRGVDGRKVKGDKGDRGYTGPRGKPGTRGPPGTCIEASTRAPIVGPAGPAGPPGKDGEAVVGPPGKPGPPGPPGPPGQPGISIVGPKGEPGEPGVVRMRQETFFKEIETNEINGDDEFYSLSTVVFRTKRGLLKRTEATALGTLAYVLQEKILLLRVETGWKHVAMASLTDSRPTSPPPPSTSNPIIVPQGIIRMAALNRPYTGKMLSRKKIGHEASEDLCYKQGQASKLGGTFRPFLAASDQGLIYLVASSDWNVPVVNLNGSILFKSWASIFINGGKFDGPATIFSFNGQSVMIDPIWPNKTVWHGSSNHYGAANLSDNCNNWRSGSKYYQGVASSLDDRLLKQEFYPCDSKFIVLCVEVEAYRGPLNPTRHKRHNRRHRFL